MHAQENYWFSNAEKHDSFSHILFVASAKVGRSQMWRENLWLLCARETLIFALPPDYKLVLTQKSICYECYNFTAAHQDAKHKGSQTPFLNGFTLNLFLGLHWIYRGKASPHSSSGPQNGITNDEYFSTVFPNGFGCGGKIGFCILVHFHKVNNPNDKRDEKAKSND